MQDSLTENEKLFVIQWVEATQNQDVIDGNLSVWMLALQANKEKLRLKDVIKNCEEALKTGAENLKVLGRNIYIADYFTAKDELQKIGHKFE